MPEPIRQTLVHYTDEAGRDLFGHWLEALTDTPTRATIAARLVRLELGLFGDSKAIGDGLHELRIDHGPGWHVYYGRQGGVLFCLWRAVINQRKKPVLKLHTRGWQTGIKERTKGSNQ